MRHHSFVEFASDADAKNGIEHVVALGVAREACTALSRTAATDSVALAAMRSWARKTVPAGATFGGIVGAVIGASMMSPVLTVGFGGLAGAALGATICGFVAGLAGASVPDPALEKLIAHLDPRAVLVVVESKDLATGEVVDGALSACGGAPVHVPWF